MLLLAIVLVGSERRNVMQIWKTPGNSARILCVLNVDDEGVILRAPVWRGRNGAPGNIGSWEQVIETPGGPVTMPAQFPRFDNENIRDIVALLKEESRA